MSATGKDEVRTLDDLRDRIDAIDAEMHRLLIERGGVIDALIRAKATSRPGAAFRPGREAAMMRRIATRHEGALPLATVEHIWREIIATFTCLQAPYEVVIDTSVEGARVHDLARFMFGYSVPVSAVSGAAAAIGRVAEGNVLAVIARAAGGAWWRALAGEARPQIMAILPFIHADGRPADLPAFLVSPPLADPTPPEARVFAVGAGASPAVPDGAAVLAEATEDGVRHRLVADGSGRDAAAIAAALAVDAADVAPVGGFYLPIDTFGRPLPLADIALPSAT